MYKPHTDTGHYPSRTGLRCKSNDLFAHVQINHLRCTNLYCTIYNYSDDAGRVVPTNRGRESTPLRPRAYGAPTGGSASPTQGRDKVGGITY